MKLKQLTVVGVMLLLMAVCAQATTTTWTAANDTPGDWSVAENWNYGEPLAGDTAVLNNLGTIQVTQAGEVCSELTTASLVDGGGTIDMSAGSLNVSSKVNLGRTTGCGDSTFLLSGGDLTTNQVDIGWYGPGVSTFTQTGGTNTNTDYIIIGRSGVGAYNISGGTLNTGKLYMGVSGGDGRFKVTGDAAAINVTGSSSAFRLYGTGTLETVIDPNISPINVTNTAYFYAGSTWNVYAKNAEAKRYDIIKAGNVVGVSNLTVNLPNNHWSWGLDSSTNTIWVEYDDSTPMDTIWTGASGTPINWSSSDDWSNGEPGPIDVAILNNLGIVEVTQLGEACSQLSIGSSTDGGGTIDMAGGTLEISTKLNLGRTTGCGDSTILLSGGELSTYEVDLGWYGPGLSTFNQTGGTYTNTNYIIIGRSGVGAYNISGGTLNTGKLYMGVSGGDGSFKVTGDDAAINVTGSSTAFRLYGSGTLTSEIDADGISTINVTDTAYFYPDSTWNIVDSGAAAGRYDIMTAGSFVGLSNLAPNFPDDSWSWGVDSETNTLWVEYNPVCNVTYSYPGYPCQMTLDILLPETEATSINLSYGQGALENSVVVTKEPTDSGFTCTLSDLQPGKEYVYQIDDGANTFDGTFSAESILPDTFIIEDFESYADTAQLNDATKVYSYGSTLTLVSDPEFSYDGSNCAKYQKSDSSYMYTGIDVRASREGALNLLPYDKLRIWYKGDLSNEAGKDITVYIRDVNDEDMLVLNTNTCTQNDGWNFYDIEIDSNDSRWAEIKRILVKASSSSGVQSTLYLDRIEAVRQTSLAGDYNDDYAVNMDDLDIFVASWLNTGNLVEFSDIAFNWLADYSCGVQFTDVYVSSDGVGNGLSPSAPASVYDQGLWRQVDVALRDYPVTVWLLDGNYDQAKRIILDYIGDETNTLTIKGQNPDGVVFNPASVVDDSLIELFDCQNIAFENLNFTGSNIIHYSLALESRTHHVTVSNCKFYDLTNTAFGVFGAHRGCHDVTVQNCTFERSGVDSYSHFIYNAYGDPTNINIDSCHFEDCSGVYVVFRDGGNGSSVTNCTFKATGTYPDNDQVKFISMSTFNDRIPDDVVYDEYFGTNYTFTGNTFDFSSVSDTVRRVVSFIHRGYDPRGDNPNTSDGDNKWHYLMTAADGAILEGSDASDKRTLLYNECGIDYNQLNISSNVYLNQTMILGFDSAAGYGAVSLGWDDIADVSDILN